MLHREDLPLETSFGSSSTIAPVARVNDLLGHYYDSILKLKNEIAELQNYRDNASIMAEQYKSDMEYIITYRKQLFAKIPKQKTPIQTQNALIQQQQQQQQVMQSYQQQYPVHLQQPPQQQIPSIPPPPIPTQQIPPPQMAPMQPQQQMMQDDRQNKELKWNVISDNPFYNKSTVSLRYAINVDSVICSVQFDPTGNFLTFSDPRNLYIINAKDGNVLNTCDLKCPQVRPEMHSRVLKFSPDGQLIAVAIAPKLIGIYSLAHNAMIRILDEHQRNVSSLQFTNDSQTLISGGFDGFICIWNMATMQLRKKFQYGQMAEDAQYNVEGGIISIVAIPNSPLYAVGFLNGRVGIYDANFEKDYCTFQAHSDRILSMIATPKGELVTTSDDKSIKIWSLIGTPTERMTIKEGHSDFVTCACSSFTNDVIISGSKDETIKAWNIDKGELMFTATAHTNSVLGLAHHPQANVFASCSGDGSICVWLYQAQ